MSAGRSACLCWTLLSVCLLDSSSAGQTIITAKEGQTVSLPCKALINDPVRAAEWSKIDPKPEEHLLLYRNDHLEYQNPSYKNRVDLKDSQIKDGDVSLILNNVTTNDSGTYECYVVQNKRDRSKRAIDPISIIRLEVDSGGHKEDGGDKDGLSREHPGLIAAVGVLAVLVVVVSLITVRHMKKKTSSPPPSSSSSSPPPPLESADQLLV